MKETRTTMTVSGSEVLEGGVALQFGGSDSDFELHLTALDAEMLAVRILEQLGELN